MERQLEQARKGILTPAMEAVASAEQVDAQVILRGIAEGHIIIPRNRNHADIPPCGIGKGLRTKINANIGTSKDPHVHRRGAGEAQGRPLRPGRTR